MIFMGKLLHGFPLRFLFFWRFSVSHVILTSQPRAIYTPSATTNNTNPGGEGLASATTNHTNTGKKQKKDGYYRDRRYPRQFR